MDMDQDLGQSQIRNLYQEHIKNTCKLIDLHSYMYVCTGYEFHKVSYDHLVQYVHSLKQYIKDQEATTGGVEESAPGDIPSSWFRT